MMKGGLGNMMKQAQKMQEDVQRAQDQEMLEDLIAAAINDSVQKLAEETKSRMSSVTAGMNLPAGMKMPF